MVNNLLFWPYLMPPPNVVVKTPNAEKQKETECEFDFICGYEEPHYTTEIEL